MTLLTAATATLGQLRYTTQIVGVSADLAALPGINNARVDIAAGVRVDAQPGTDATVELDGGDGAATIITGTVQRVSRDARATRVTVTDAAAALAATRPHETYNAMPAVQVISKLADLAQVDTGLVITTLQTAAYIADGTRTAAQHVALLAELGGGIASVDADGRLTVMPWPVGPPTAAMRRDREFTSLSTSHDRAGHEFAVVGASGAAAGAAPDAWLASTDAVTGADDPDGFRTWITEPLLRTAVDVDLANSSLATRRAAETHRLQAECWLQPARRPGDVVQIQHTQHDDEAGPWLLTGVTHRLGTDHAQTTLTGVSVADDGGLLGALAGAVGGLL